MGTFVVEHYDSENRLKGKYSVRNAVKTEGKNYVLSHAFSDETGSYPWYIGLVDASGWASDPSTDTLVSHAGWTEFTGYSGNRKNWTPDAASGGTISNTSIVSFSITATGSLKGMMICDAATGTTGTMWSTANFLTPINVLSGDTIRITYTVGL